MDVKTDNSDTSKASGLRGPRPLLAAMAILVATLAATWLAGVHVRDHETQAFQDVLLQVLLVGVAPLPLTAIPFAFSRDPARFRQAIIWTAATLTGGSLIFAYFGWFLYLPAALLLLLAILVTPATRRWVTAAGVVVCLATTGGFTAAIYQSLLVPPNAYKVYVGPDLTFEQTMRIAEQIRQIPEVETVPDGAGSNGDGTWITVGFDVGLFTIDRAKMARLERRLRELPDVTRVEVHPRGLRR